MSDAPPPPVIKEDWLRLAEALVFASAAPVGAQRLSQILPEAADADAVITALRARYAGRGVEAVDAAGGVMFRTAPDLVDKLRKVVEVPRRLPRAAMETLAVVAYHQPVTRPEIDEIRGASLAQQTLDALLEAALIAPKGHRDSPGRPTLWATTPEFLVRFGLNDLRDLPRREDLLVESPSSLLLPEASGPESPFPLREGDRGRGVIEGEPTPPPDLGPLRGPSPQGEGEHGHADASSPEPDNGLS